MRTYNLIAATLVGVRHHVPHNAKELLHDT
jgi:hypothetical protein